MSLFPSRLTLHWNLYTRDLRDLCPGSVTGMFSTRTSPIDPLASLTLVVERDQRHIVPLSLPLWPLGPTRQPAQQRIGKLIYT